MKMTLHATAQARQELIKRMEKAGAEVITEDTGKQYLVKIRMPGKRQIQKGSTSGYPILQAYEKWLEENPDAEVLAQ